MLQIILDYKFDDINIYDYQIVYCKSCSYYVEVVIECQTKAIVFKAVV